MSMRLVALVGEPGAGKDTAAKALIDKGYQALSFGALVYEEVSEAFGFPKEALYERSTKETPLPALALAGCTDKEYIEVARAYLREQSSDSFLLTPRSPRFHLQVWATNYKRAKYGQDYYIRAVARAIARDPLGAFVITDLRSQAEFDFIKGKDGLVVRVVAKGRNADTNAMAHTVEQVASTLPADFILPNLWGSPELLRMALLTAVSSHFEEMIAT